MLTKIHNWIVNKTQLLIGHNLKSLSVILTHQPLNTYNFDLECATTLVFVLKCSLICVD